MDIGDLVTTINILVNAKYSKIVKVAGKLEITHVNKDIQEHYAQNAIFITEKEMATIVKQKINALHVQMEILS